MSEQPSKEAIRVGLEPAPASQLLYPGHLALQQRVLPTYRLPFLSALADACQAGLTVFTGQPRTGESITSIDPLLPVDTSPKLTIHFTANRHWLRPNSSFYLCWQDQLLEWLKREEPDALIVEANPRIRSTPPAIRWMHTRHRPVLGWGLGAPVPRGSFSSWRRRGWPGFLIQFEALIAYSPLGAEQYRLHGYPAESIFIAPNAVTPRPSTSPPKRSETLSDQPAVLFVGRLQTRKRVDLLLHAAAALPTGFHPRLVIVGDGPAMPDLKTLAQKIYPTAEFPGEQSGSDLEPYFTNADLFVLPGTGGLAVQQAMAHGLPVVAAQGDGSLDSLIRPENGWRVPSSDLPALTSALQTALADIARLRRMGAESYRIVSEEVNLEAMVHAFIQALFSINRQ